MVQHWSEIGSNLVRNWSTVGSKSVLLYLSHNASAPKYEDAVARTGPPRRRPLRGSDVRLVDSYLDTPGATRLPRVARGPQQQRLRLWAKPRYGRKSVRFRSPDLPPGSNFHETDPRNPIFGVPGPLGAKLGNSELGGGGAHVCYRPFGPRKRVRLRSF